MLNRGIIQYFVVKNVTSQKYDTAVSCLLPGVVRVDAITRLIHAVSHHTRPTPPASHVAVHRGNRRHVLVFNRKLSVKVLRNPSRIRRFRKGRNTAVHNIRDGHLRRRSAAVLGTEGFEGGVADQGAPVLEGLLLLLSCWVVEGEEK